MGLNSPRINATVSGTTVATALTAEELNVTGATTTLATTNTVITDKLIELANGTSGAPSGDAGIIIERGSSTNAAIVWDESRDEFILGTTSATGASTGDLTVTPGNVSVERIGCGTEQAEAEVHAKRDTASGVQYSTTATIISEDDTRPSIQLAGGANNIGLIQFGDNAAVASGQVYYDHSTDKLRIDCGGNGDRLTLDADGDLVLAGGITATTGGECVFGNVGIGATAPKVSLNVLNDYHTTTFETQLTDGQGGGQILRYGSSATLVLGGLYYLKSDGVWTAALASAVATGATQLLGISMGTDAQVGGLLLNGFVRIPSTEILNVPGSGAVDGLPVYVSKTTAGHLDFTAPAAGSDFVRIVGYAIDDDSSDVLVYINPDSTHVEL